eukprot:79563_1
MSKRDLFRLTPSHREIIGILDFSSIIDKYDTYQHKNVVMGNQFALDDLQFQVYCYPKGNSTSQSGRVSLFIQALNASKQDERTIYVSTTRRSNERMQYELIQPVHKFMSGHGWDKRFTYSELQAHPVVDVKIKFHDDSLSASGTSDTFLEQTEKMYELSEMHGDVTLIIKLPRNNDLNSNNYLYSPSKKKRKLNNPYQCSVCNKEFQSEHGLKVHQSKKKDEAHKNYKNNNDDMNDSDTGLGSNDHEIKFSSLILRSASKVFERMLDTNRLEKQEKRIGIEVRSVDDIKAFTYFMSTNMLKSDCNPWNILELAHYYEMNRLFQQCVDRIINNITIQNFPQTINVFDKFQIETGYQKLIQFAKQNFDELKKAPGFDTIPHSFKCCIPCCVPVLNNQ